jgi:hypothetical protein
MVSEKTYKPKRPAALGLTHEEGCWIKYQLNLHNLTYRTVAHIAGLGNVTTVADFLHGFNTSEKCKAALCKILGYPDFETLRAAANGKGGAA